MVSIKEEITKEEYEKALKEGASSLIDDYWFMSYGVYGSQVYQSETDGKYYLYWQRGDSCD